MTDESFGESVQTRLTQRVVVFIFERAKISDENFGKFCKDLKTFETFENGKHCSFDACLF